MENEINNTNESKHLCFDNNAKQQLAGVRKWAQVISIVGFVFLAFMVLMAITTLSAGLFFEYGEYSIIRSALLPVTGIAYIIFLALYFFLFYYLYRFSAFAGRAINSNETNDLVRSLSFLKKHYLLIVVFTVVYIVFVIIFAIVTFSTVLTEFGTLS